MNIIRFLRGWRLRKRVQLKLWKRAWPGIGKMYALRFDLEHEAYVDSMTPSQRIRYELDLESFRRKIFPPSIFPKQYK